MFMNSLNALGLDKCIEVPTYIKGRTIDSVLTNNKNVSLISKFLLINVFESLIITLYI